MTDKRFIATLTAIVCSTAVAIVYYMTGGAKNETD